MPSPPPSTPNTLTSKQVHLAARPQGWPAPDDFRLVEVPVPAPDDGQLVVRNQVMSVDPYMRGRMNAGRSYVAPFEVGEVMDGGAVGEVLESRADGFAPGDLVLHGAGWREIAVVPARSARRVERLDGIPVSAYLGVLGMPGLTAYAGLLEVAGMREGETVFVSAAAGAVGSTAGQIARLRGAARVIGSAGSEEKVAHLTGPLRFDAALNYKRGELGRHLREAAPDGIDVYFDNVGGDHLEAALGAMNNHGRIAACGAISAYNATEAPAAPRNLSLVVGKRITLRGFIVGDHSDLMPQFQAQMTGWLRAGEVLLDETVVDGIDHAVDAFLGMLRGQNTGKMIVRLA